MFSKKKFILANKINILLLILIVVVNFMPITLSRYESIVVGSTNANIAFYLIEPNYYTKDIKLSSLSPSNEGYVYNFSVSNYNDVGNSEVDLEYVLSLVTTTNLPLRYELYMNCNYLDDSCVNLVSDDNSTFSKDDYGTYFKYITLQKEEMLYVNKVRNDYTLVVYYDVSNDNSLYQNMVENVRVVIDSSQIVD